MSSLFRLTVFSVMCFSLFSFSRTAEEDAVYSYIDQFKELAVVEMHRSGIPASITLAQASNFLMSTAHYLPLFNFEHTDYKSWANGLKNCGYATDQKYAQKLISKIEKYELNQFDAWENPYKLIMGQ